MIEHSLPLFLKPTTVYHRKVCHSRPHEHKPKPQPVAQVGGKVGGGSAQGGCLPFFRRPHGCWIVPIHGLRRSFEPEARSAALVRHLECTAIARDFQFTDLWSHGQHLTYRRRKSLLEISNCPCDCRCVCYYVYVWVMWRFCVQRCWIIEFLLYNETPVVQARV